MAKKKSKKSNANFALGRNSKWILLGAALVLAVAVVYGVFSFAGGAKTKGRVFSWRQGKVLNSYGQVSKAPTVQYAKSVIYRKSDGKACGTSVSTSAATVNCASANTTNKVNTWIQYKYADPKWDGAYLSVYAEPTSPALIGSGSRDLKANLIGEDVAAVKRALQYIGYYKVYEGDPTGKATRKEVALRDTAKGAAFKRITEEQIFKFDTQMTDALNALKETGMDSSYGAYLKDGKLDAYEKLRILSIATDPGNVLDSTRVAFDYKSKGLLVGGKKYARTDIADSKSKVYGWENHAGIWRGEKEFLSSGETTSSLYLVNALLTAKTNPGFKSRVPKEGDKGEDIRVYQAMLMRVDAKAGKALNFKGLNMNGKWDRNTINATKQYQAFHGLGQSGRMNRRTNTQLFRDVTWPIYR